MKRIVGVDLFAGAGGMSLGAALSGISGGLAVEFDRFAARTYMANHSHTVILNKDVRSVSPGDLRRVGAGSALRILFGGPPCHGFSYSNLRTRTVDNPNNWLFAEFIRIAAIWRPDWLVFENVRGLVNTACGTFLLQVREQLHRLKYTLFEAILNAMDYGVPQDRARFFLVGCRHNGHFRMPQPFRRKPLTVRAAISDLPDLPNGASVSLVPYRAPPTSPYARRLRGALKASANHLVSRNAELVIKRYRYISPGGNWENVPARLMRNYQDRSRCHTGIYYRLPWDRPSIVIGNYRKNMLIHPEQDRGLSVREAARIQSFPDWYEFQGSIGFQQQQVADAVPPLLAKAVFKAILSHSGL